MNISFNISRTLAFVLALCTCANILLAQKPKPNFGISLATPPTILSTTPTKNKINVANNTNIIATFNTDMNTSTLNSSNVAVFGSQSGKHNGAITLNGVTGFTLNPTNDFKAGEVVSVNLKSSIQSGGSLPLDNGYHWNFISKVSGGTGVFTQTSVAGLGITAQPIASTSGDFDGDGDIDLVTVNQGSNDISILLNDGHGVFTSSTMSAGSGRTGVVTGDWDNDGDLDLAVIGGGATGSAAILINDGSGVFTLSSSPSTGIGPQAVASADVDGDGDLDLVVALNSVNQVAILTNNGSGTFTSVATPTVGTAPQALTVADFNGDGTMDIAVVNFIGSTGSLLMNDGTGTSWTLSAFATGTQPNSIVSGDFDNDGDADLAVANQTGNTLTILKNNGIGSFSVFASPAVTNQPYSLSALDVDNDGDLDLTVTQFSADSVSTFKNNGTGTFTSFSKVSVQGQPSTISFGDFDGDGDADLAVTNRSGHSVSILKNNFIPPTVTTLSPTNNQINASQNTNIVLRFNQAMNPSTLSTSNIFVFGSLSGKHTGVVTRSNSDSTMTFNPDTDFFKDEVVSVNLSQNIVSATADTLAHGFHYNFTTLTSGGTTVFTQTSTTGVGNNPFDLVTADFDNDGDADIASANNSASTVSILLNNGTGNFTTSSSVAVGANPQGIVAGDFDNDGDIDLAVASATSSTVSILKNDGSGLFTVTSTFSTGVSALELAVGDVDGDGDLDIAVVITGNPVKILVNDGTGAFTGGSNTATESGPDAISLTDVDNDGDLDMVVVNSIANTITINKNDGTGAFPTSASVAVGVYPTALAVGDIDADGDNDIVVVNVTSGTLSVLKNNGTGTFSISSSPAVGSGAVSVTMGNFDNDTDLDVAVLNQGDADITILKNNGTGALTSSTVSDISASPAAITSADWDGDGDVDLAIASAVSAHVGIIKNNVTPSFALSHSSINYGDVALGLSKRDSVEVTNSGSAPLTITFVSSSSTSFAATPNGGTVSASDSMKFYITFIPGSVGSLSGRIIFEHNAAGIRDTVLVSGNGIPNPAPVFTLSASRLAFGDIVVGNNYTDSVTVTNNGPTDDLDVSEVSSDNPKVTVTPTDAIIPQGTSETFYITVSPDVVESVKAVITFTHDASGSPSTLQVTSNALLAIPHYFLSVTPDTMTVKTPGKKSFLVAVKRKKHLKPNWANLMSEVVAQGGFQANATESDSMGGMRVGISHITQKGVNKFKINKDSAAVMAWVRLTKWTFPTSKAAGKGSGFEALQKTLEDKSGKHDSLARGFDSTGYPSQPKKRKALLKELTSLPPATQDNKLFGELVALKFNIAASQLGKTPVGFGELVFDLNGNPFDEMQVKAISRKADSALTYWSGVNQLYYDSLYSTIHRINNAFVGPIDTLSFENTSKLVLKGVVDVSTVPFLRYTPSATPTRLTPALAVSDEVDNSFKYTDESTPEIFALDQNYPNPFNPTTTFSFVVGQSSLVTLKVFNVLGQEVATILNNQQLESGSHDFTFDASSLSSGVYLYRITAQSIDENGNTSSFTDMKRMVLVK